jgi:hypothetical protein
MPAGGGEDREVAPGADSKTRRGEDEGQRLTGERITVALIAKVAEQLQRLQGATGLSKTDIVNRSISLYDFLQTQMDADHDIIVRDRTTGETQIVKFL